MDITERLAAYPRCDHGEPHIAVPAADVFVAVQEITKLRTGERIAFTKIKQMAEGKFRGCGSYSQRLDAIVLLCEELLKTVETA